MRKDFDAIAELNVSAYAEFASRLRPGSWEAMQKNLRNIAEKAEIAEFMVCRLGNDIVGSVAYCPAEGRSNNIQTRHGFDIVVGGQSMHRGKV